MLTIPTGPDEGMIIKKDTFFFFKKRWEHVRSGKRARWISQSKWSPYFPRLSSEDHPPAWSFQPGFAQSSSLEACACLCRTRMGWSALLQMRRQHQRHFAAEGQQQGRRSQIRQRPGPLVRSWGIRDCRSPPPSRQHPWAGHLAYCFVTEQWPGNPDQRALGQWVCLEFRCPTVKFPAVS